MLSIPTKKHLCDLIVGIAEGERRLEICRQILCELRAFEPYTGFIRLDRLSQKYLTARDLSNFFISNNIQIPYADVQLIIRNIDKDHDSKLIFEEFEDAVLPKNAISVKMQTQGRTSYYVAEDEFLEYDVEMALARLFEQIAVNAKKYDILKTDFRGLNDYDARAAFQALDQRRSGFIDFVLVDEFTKYFGRPLSENEIIAFIQYADIDRDMRLNFTEFAEVLIPGLPAPQQTSPLKSSKILLENQSTYHSPVKQSEILKQALFTPSKVVKYSHGSPGGQFIAQSFAKDNDLKEIDNLKYSEYLQKSNKKSEEKKSANHSSGKKIGSGMYQSPLKESQAIKNSYSPQLNQKDEEYLMGLLKQMIIMDRTLQKIRIELTLQQDFNLQDIYRLFDVNQNQRVSKWEVENSLNKIGIFPTKNELFLFFVKFDEDIDGYISYGEFSKIFYNFDLSQVSLINSREPKYIEPLEGETIQDIFSFETQQIIKQLFNQIFENEANIDAFRSQLQNRPTFNLYDAFNSLDLNADGMVSYEELKEMLKCYGIYTSDKDIMSLFKRFDKDQDGEIKYAEFAQEMTTKSPIRYFNK